MRCKYCWKDTDDKEYCSFECRKAYLDFSDNEDRTGARKKPLLIASVLVSIPFIILFYGAGVTLMCTLIGITLITHPFPSQEVRKNLPPKDAQGAVVKNGIMFIIIGLPFLLLTGTWLSF